MNDVAAPKDVIGFEPYVTGLARFLLDDRTLAPLTVSIEGEWGTGKSSFMLQLAAAISAQAKRGTRAAAPRSEQAPIVIPFNAWRHDRDEMLWASFALEFSRQVRASLPLRSRLWRNARFVWANRSWGDLKSLIFWVGVVVLSALLLDLSYESWFTLREERHSGLRNLVELAIRFWPLGAPAVTLVGSALVRLLRNPVAVDLEKQRPGYKHKIGLLEQFHEDFARFATIYSSDRRTFVVVDDLDRCELVRSAELLQALHLMLPESAKVFLIVAMDRRKIAAGIAQRNRPLLELLGPPDHGIEVTTESRQQERAGGIEYGYEFMEKFVQLPVRIPHLGPPALPAFLDEILGESSPPRNVGVAEPSGNDESAEPDEHDLRAVMEMVAPSLEHNPRRLKQFLNLFRLRCHVAATLGAFAPTAKSGWTLQQLGKVVALELRWPTLFDEVLKDPRLLEELWRRAGSSAQEPGDLPATLKPWWRAPLLQLVRWSNPDRPETHELSSVSALISGLYGTSLVSSTATPRRG